MATPPTFTAGQVLTAAQMNAVGLWKVTPSSVSGSGVTLSSGTVVLNGATSAVINDCFPSDFKNFRVVISNISGSTSAQDILFQLRSTSNVTTNYQSGGAFWTYAGSSGAITSLTNRIPCGGASNTAKTNATLDVFNPNQTLSTGYTSIVQNFDAFVIYGGQNTNITAYSNCGFGVASGTITGEISFYGYR